MNSEVKYNVPNYFQIAYIALNDAALISKVFSYYRELAIDVTLYLDDRTNSENIEALHREGISFISVHNEYNFVEGLYGVVAGHVDQEWVMILTSDEIITRDGIIAIDRLIESVDETTTTIEFHRRWLYRDANGDILYSRARRFGIDHQPRIIRHRQVVFSAVVHSPGHLFKSAVLAPDEAMVYHLDWIVHSRALRERKLNFYETIKEGSKKEYSIYYLPEDDLVVHDMHPLNVESVSKFSKECSLLMMETGWSDDLQNQDKMKNGWMRYFNHGILNYITRPFVKIFL